MKDIYIYMIYIYVCIHSLDMMYPGAIPTLPLGLGGTQADARRGQKRRFESGESRSAVNGGGIGLVFGKQHIIKTDVTSGKYTHTRLIQKKVETTDPIFNMASRFFRETFYPWSEVQCLTCPLIRFQSETQLMCCWVEDGGFFLRIILCQNLIDEFSKLDDTLKNNFRKPGMLQMGQGMGMFHHIGSTFRFLNSIAMVYSQKRNVDSNWSGSFKIIWMLVRRRGSGKCLQEQLVWRVRLMQFLCLNSLDRKDQGFRKMHKNTRMEFEETRTHTHTHFH